MKDVAFLFGWSLATWHFPMSNEVANTPSHFSIFERVKRSICSLASSGLSKDWRERFAARADGRLRRIAEVRPCFRRHESRIGDGPADAGDLLTGGRKQSWRRAASE
jgi:hypothetical protein